MTVNFVVVSDLKYVWDVIISICSKALRQVIRRMSSKFSNSPRYKTGKAWIKLKASG